MYLYALSFVDSDVEAEDIVQDIFYQYWKTGVWKTLEEGAVKTYLFRAVKNVCLNYLNKKDVLRGRVEIWDEAAVDEECEGLDEALVERIRRDIDAMAPQTREIIMSIFYKDQKYQEVADRLGISVNTVKTLLRRAMQHLRDRYSDCLLAFLFYIFS